MYYRPGRHYQIPAGPFKGINLIYQSDVNFHMMIGAWELEMVRMLQLLATSPVLLPRDGVLLDIGANIGLISLFGARDLVPQGSVYAFEPAPRTYGMLLANLHSNPGLSSVSPHPLAMSDKIGQTDFFVGSHHHQSSLSEDWAGPQSRVTVDCTTVDDFCKGRNIKPHLIKMDIEGGGVWAFPGMAHTGAAHRPLVIVESHTPDEDRAIADYIRNQDYLALRMSDRQWVKNPQNTWPDQGGIMGSLLLCPVEKRSDLENLLKR